MAAGCSCAAAPACYTAAGAGPEALLELPIAVSAAGPGPAALMTPAPELQLASPWLRTATEEGRRRPAAASAPVPASAPAAGPPAGGSASRQGGWRGAPARDVAAWLQQRSMGLLTRGQSMQGFGTSTLSAGIQAAAHSVMCSPPCSPAARPALHARRATAEAGPAKPAGCAACHRRWRGRAAGPASGCMDRRGGQESTCVTSHPLHPCLSRTLPGRMLAMRLTALPVQCMLAIRCTAPPHVRRRPTSPSCSLRGRLSLCRLQLGCCLPAPGCCRQGASGLTLQERPEILSCSTAGSGCATQDLLPRLPAPAPPLPPHWWSLSSLSCPTCAGFLAVPPLLFALTGKNCLGLCSAPYSALHNSGRCAVSQSTFESTMDCSPPCKTDNQLRDTTPSMR